MSVSGIVRGCRRLVGYDTYTERIDILTHRILIFFSTAGSFVLIPCLIAIICTIGVFCTVRSQAQRNSRYAAVSAGYIREVRSQGALYALAYLNSMVWILVIGILSGDIDIQLREGTSGLFAVQMIAALMYPLQGFLNFAVYARPRYLDWRMHGYTRLGAVAKAMALEPYDPHRSQRHKLQPVSLRRIQSNEDSKKSLHTCREASAGDVTTNYNQPEDEA